MSFELLGLETDDWRDSRSTAEPAFLGDAPPAWDTAVDASNADFAKDSATELELTTRGNPVTSSLSDARHARQNVAAAAASLEGLCVRNMVAAVKAPARTKTALLFL